MAVDMVSKVKFGETKHLRCAVVPPVGNYALEDLIWDHCREQFAAKFDECTKGFYFSHPAGKSIDVSEFIAKFESIIDAEPSCFSKTDKEKILWIEPSMFWRNCQIKRSLLTIILRCAMNYIVTDDNFDDALFGEYLESAYIRETRSAVLRFMFGFTHFAGIIPASMLTSSTVIKHGWREEFKPLDDSTIRRRLVLPDGKSKEISIIGVESLWT